MVGGGVQWAQANLGWASRVRDYEELYRRRAYLPAAERQRIAKLVDASQLTNRPPTSRILEGARPQRVPEQEMPRLF